jgi:CRP-like cAMP-binding protein
LLLRLNPDDLSRLRPHLEEVSLKRGETFIMAKANIEHVYFPETGIASVVAECSNGKAEVGLYGRDGTSAFAFLLGVEQSPYRHIMQVGGTLNRIAADTFGEILKERPGIRDLMLLYVWVFGVQIAQTAVANATLKVKEKLARWLLMCHDRIGSRDIRLTHEFIAIMLSIRRATVTEEIAVLAGAGAIQGLHGRVKILDRTKLLTIAGDAYGVPEAEYKRLLGGF